MNIEFAITLRCNVKCPCCSRHSYLHGSETDITQEQLERFIEEVKSHGNVKVIWITGGEPTIHPEFINITDKLKYELLDKDYIKRLIIVSNGTNPIKLNYDIEKDIFPPKEKNPLFRCQYVAPYDTGQETRVCPVPITDGCGFSVYGWYPCGGGSAIAMLFNMIKYRRDKIPETIDDFGDFRNLLCRLCQVSAKKWMLIKDFGEIKSVSFRKAFRNFDVNRLWRY